MAEITVPSGAKVNINVAPFLEVMRLKSAIQRSFADSKIEINFNDNISEMVKTIMEIDSDPEVGKYLFKCLERCTYNGEKITENTFEPEKAREDYYDIVIECLKVNLSPFFKGLVSKWNGISGSLVKKPDSQK